MNIDNFLRRFHLKILEENLHAAGNRILEKLRENGGPTEDQYEELNELYRSINSKRKQGIMSDNDVLSIWQAIPDVYCTTDTMQGYVVLKPRGYDGDFIIIERIYQGWLSPKKYLVNWDRFFMLRPLQRQSSTEKITLLTCFVL